MIWRSEELGGKGGLLRDFFKEAGKEADEADGQGKDDDEREKT